MYKPHIHIYKPTYTYIYIYPTNKVFLLGIKGAASVVWRHLEGDLTSQQPG
jgi:hypothetical protein